MNCKLEENSRRYDVLCALAKGYETGDFSELFPFLAKDCVLESQWVLTPNTGYDAVVSYLTGKGKTLVKYECLADCSIVELVDNCRPVKMPRVIVNGEAPKQAYVGLMYTPGTLCLLMKQTLDGETNSVLVDVSIDDEGMVKRIDLCMPELFRFRPFDTHARFNPAAADRKDDGQVTEVRNG